MFGEHSAGEFLTLATYLTRDISTIWTLVMAGLSLVLVSIGRPQARQITGGALVWFVALGGYLSPVDQSWLFSRDTISFMLNLALVLWVLVFISLILAAAERQLQR